MGRALVKRVCASVARTSGRGMNAHIGGRSDLSAISGLEHKLTLQTLFPMSLKFAQQSALFSWHFDTNALVNACA